MKRFWSLTVKVTSPSASMSGWTSRSWRTSGPGHAAGAVGRRGSAAKRDRSWCHGNHSRLAGHHVDPLARRDTGLAGLHDRAPLPLGRDLLRTPGSPWSGAVPTSACMPVTRRPWLCLFERGDDSRARPSGGSRSRSVRSAGGSGFVPGMGDGQRYAYQVDGPWDPRTACGTTSTKLLLDPTPKAIGAPSRGVGVYGHEVDDEWAGDLMCGAPSTTPPPCLAVSSSMTTSTGRTTLHLWSAVVTR